MLTRVKALDGARSFAMAREGVGAIEFAVIAPMLILLICGVFELSRYVKAARQLTAVSTTIASMVAQNTTGSVNDTDLLFFRDATMIAYPDVLVNAAAINASWLNDIQITVSSVGFSLVDPSCGSNCGYQAKVLWTGGSSMRPCSVYLASAPDDAQPTSTTLPADVFGPGTLIVVDVGYRYRPLVAARLLPPMTLSRSFYIQPRYVSSVTYAPNGTNFATTCPAS